MHIESRSLHHENTVIVIPQLRCFQLYSPCGELYWLRQLYLLRKLYWALPVMHAFDACKDTSHHLS